MIFSGHASRKIPKPRFFFVKKSPNQLFFSRTSSNSIRLASSIVNIFKSTSAESRKNSYRPDSNANSNSANLKSANLNAFNPDKSSDQTPLKHQISSSSINNKRLILPLENAPGFTNMLILPVTKVLRGSMLTVKSHEQFMTFFFHEILRKRPFFSLLEPQKQSLDT